MKRARPSKHYRNIKTKKGRKRVLINPTIKKKKISKRRRLVGKQRFKSKLVSFVDISKGFNPDSPTLGLTLKEPTKDIVTPEKTLKDLSNIELKQKVREQEALTRFLTEQQVMKKRKISESQRRFLIKELNKSLPEGIDVPLRADAEQVRNVLELVAEEKFDEKTLEKAGAEVHPKIMSESIRLRRLDKKTRQLDKSLAALSELDPKTRKGAKQLLENYKIFKVPELIEKAEDDARALDKTNVSDDVSTLKQEIRNVVNQARQTLSKEIKPTKEAAERVRKIKLFGEDLPLSEEKELEAAIRKERKEERRFQKEAKARQEERTREAFQETQKILKETEQSRLLGVRKAIIREARSLDRDADTTLEILGFGESEIGEENIKAGKEYIDFLKQKK